MEVHAEQLLEIDFIFIFCRIVLNAISPLLSFSRQKPPVVRGARACTTCRAAKVICALVHMRHAHRPSSLQMKCVGAEDGQRQCQRCKRANVQYATCGISFKLLPYVVNVRCIFEKHRRGRKPGSKYAYSLS